LMDWGRVARYSMDARGQHVSAISVNGEAGAAQIRTPTSPFQTLSRREFDMRQIARCWDRKEVCRTSTRSFGHPDPIRRADVRGFCRMRVWQTDQYSASVRRRDSERAIGGNANLRPTNPRQEFAGPLRAPMTGIG
jgi:hypothetical protein